MAEDKIIIVNTDRGKDRLHVKVRRKMRNGFSPNEYCKVVNAKDARDVAMLMEDLHVIVGVPIDKAFRIYQENKDKSFPF